MVILIGALLSGCAVLVTATALTCTFFLVDPNPFFPRILGGKRAASTSRGLINGYRIICAILSPLVISNCWFDRLMRMTSTSPLYPESMIPPSTVIPLSARLLRGLIDP